jgi:hypothetical protein
MLAKDGKACHGTDVMWKGNTKKGVLALLLAFQLVTELALQRRGCTRCTAIEHAYKAMKTLHNACHNV